VTLGSAITKKPTVLKAFTTFAPASFACTCSPDEVSLAISMPPWANLMALVASITILPPTLPRLASVSSMPFHGTASTIMFAAAAASLGDSARAFFVLATRSLTLCFCGSREP
jgi:hypothetical protein